MSSDPILPASLRLQALGQSIHQMAIGEDDSYPTAVKRVACLLLVRHARGAYSYASEVNKELAIYYPNFADRVIRSNFALWRITGGVKNLSSLLAKGGIIPAGALGKWSPDFLYGLSKSGVFKASEARHTKVTSTMGSRPVLKALLNGEYGNLPFHCSATCNPSHPNGLFLSGAWGLFAGADNPEGVGVLAGFLCGGRKIIHEGQSWLGLVAKGDNASLLDSFSIPYFQKHLEGRSDTLLVSPFWGALLSNEMPEQLGDWFEGWEHRRGLRVGMYPLLPWAFLRAVWGVGTCYTIPLNIVPFLTDRNTLRENHGIGMRSVREQAFIRLGFIRVDPRLRDVWLRRLVLKGFTRDSFPEGKVPVDLP